MNPMRKPSRRIGALMTLPTNTAEVSVLPSLPGAAAHPSLTLWNHVREAALAGRSSSMAASGDAGVGWPRFNSSGGPNQTTEDVKRVFHRFRELPGEMFRCAAKTHTVEGHFS